MASSLSGPIPAHPMYRTRSAGGDFSARPVPRVRPEAQDIYTQHQGCVGRVLEVTGQSMSYAAPSSKYKPSEFSLKFSFIYVFPRYNLAKTMYYSKYMSP